MMLWEYDGMHLLFLAIVLTIGFIWYGNNYIKVTRYGYCKNVSNNLNGYKILHLSDIHGDLPMGKYKLLLGRIRAVEPDLVVVTGDCIDNIHIRSMDKVLALFDEIRRKYPIYVVTGNHEYMHQECSEFIDAVRAIGIVVLSNTFVDIHCGNEKIQLVGIDDPLVLYDGNMPEKYKTPVKEYKRFIKDNVKIDKRGYAHYILLAHRPEFLEEYSNTGVDIVFSGHAHGGQWRLPLIGGVIAPDQGLFPKYTQGEYFCGNTIMYVSRGLGNSVVPFRLFNNPELVVVEFKRSE